MYSDFITYIGVNDNDIDLFEGQYPAPRGISYNSYLLNDEQLTVMDAVDCRKWNEYGANLQSALQGRKPAYLVVSHVEPDHASSIGRFMELYPETTLVGNAKTFQFLAAFFTKETVDNWNKVTVKDGDTLSIGSHTLKFLFVPMVHWPEVMFTWVEEEKTLFSADAFGTFDIFDGSSESSQWDSEAARYYCNIVGKYGPQVISALKKVESLDIRQICPLHGPVLTETIGHAVSLYEKWAAYEPEKENSVMVAYASLHGNTAYAAKIMEEALTQNGAEVTLVDLNRTEHSYAVAQAFRSGKWVLMSSTYNAQLPPAMDNFLRLAAGKNLQNRTVALVENGLWAPSAVKNMTVALQQMKNVTIIENSITIKGSVKEEDKAEIENLARKIVKN